MSGLPLRVRPGRMEPNAVCHRGVSLLAGSSGYVIAVCKLLSIRPSQLVSRSHAVGAVVGPQVEMSVNKTLKKKHEWETDLHSKT